MFAQFVAEVKFTFKKESNIDVVVNFDVGAQECVQDQGLGRSNLINNREKKFLGKFSERSFSTLEHHEQLTQQRTMSNHEDDYMSDAFLKVQEKKAEPHTFKKRKAPEIVKIPSLKERENKHREEGLSTPLSEDNKGFKMLKMMGYQKGMSIGKQPQSLSTENKVSHDTIQPLIDPIAINIKHGRLGLGIEEQENNEVDELAKQPPLTQEMLSSFQDRMKNKFIDKKIQGDIYKALKLCFRMDTDALDNSTTTTQSPFYKDKSEFDEEELKILEESRTKEVIFEKPDFTVLPLDEKLEKVLLYLRSTYLYCFYCGSKFQSEEELAQRCPGLLEEDH